MRYAKLKPVHKSIEIVNPFNTSCHGGTSKSDWSRAASFIVLIKSGREIGSSFIYTTLVPIGLCLVGVRFTSL